MTTTQFPHFLCNTMKNKYTLAQVEEAQSKLDTCPFCGCNIEIGICDKYGDYQMDYYLDDPEWGLSFSLTHKQNAKCILHADPYYSARINEMMFDNLEELVESWNKRVKKGGEA